MGIGAFSIARALYRWPAYALIFSQIHRSKNRSGASDSNTPLRIDRVPPYGPIKVMAGNLRRGHLRRSKPPDPTFYHAIRLIDDDRKHEAELLNPRLELADVLGEGACGFLFRAAAGGRRRPVLDEDRAKQHSRYRAALNAVSQFTPSTEGEARSISRFAALRLLRVN